MRSWFGLLGVAVLCSACGNSVAPVKSQPVTANYRLWLRTNSQVDSQIQILDARHDRVVRRFSGGSVAPDWSRVYQIDRGRLRSVATDTGQTLAETAVPTGFDFPRGDLFGDSLSGLSPKGAYLALQSLDRDGQLVVRSHYLVLNTSLSFPAVRIDLNGDFEYDALADDGSRLFLLEYTSRSETFGDQYRVRAYDLRTHRLQPGVIVDKRESASPEPMSGSRVTAVSSTDGSWLYSLYLFGDKGPFIHALNLGGNGPAAWCIDLPQASSANGEAQLLWSMVRAPNADRFYAVNAGLGIIAQVDAGNPPTISRTGRFAVQRQSAFDFFGLVLNAEAKRMLIGGAALSLDGNTLYAVGEDGVYVIDVSSFRLLKHVMAGAPLESVSLSPDGEWLFGSSNQRQQVLALQLKTGASSKTSVDPGIAAVLRAEPAAD